MQQPLYNTSSTEDSRRPRILWALSGIAILLVSAIIVLFLTNHSSSNTGFPKADQEKSTTFQGMSSFVNNGLSTDQVNKLTAAFSKFSPSAKSVSVDTNSLTPGPHDPNVDTSFKINFLVKIDSVSYKGTVSYFGLETIRLFLYDQAGKQLFDSGAADTAQ